VRTRLVETGDAAAMLAIWNPEVLETSVSFDLETRTITEQVAWIDEHRGPHPCLVAIGDGDVGDHTNSGERLLGFASLSRFREKPAYATTAESSIYVHRDARGQRVGERLLTDLLAAAVTSGFHSVIARIVGENRPSILLHERCGFTVVGTEVEVGRKHGQWLDVIQYQCVLGGSSPTRS
jgi:L-amino acid N-acyltransferase